MNKTITESDSNYDKLEEMSTKELLTSMNNEDKTVPQAVEKAIPQIEKLVNITAAQLEKGGRLFYIGSGTSGRLGILDASECPPTFGVDHGLVLGIIAGGDAAIRKAQEFAEDDVKQGFKDLLDYDINQKDVLVGLSASGTAPYVLGALKESREKGITTACVTCNPDAPMVALSDYPVEVIVGPEFVTGSTRMKAGTAQKLVLNMLTTSVMIKLGRVKGNKMVDMQLSNQKLIKRGSRMLANLFKLEEEEAKRILLKHGSVRKAIGELEKSG